MGTGAMDERMTEDEWIEETPCPMNMSTYDAPLNTPRQILQGYQGKRHNSEKNAT